MIEPFDSLRIIWANLLAYQEKDIIVIMLTNVCKFEYTITEKKFFEKNKKLLKL